MVTTTDTLTREVPIVKLPLVAPAGMVIELGTVATELLVLREITAPPAGAEPVNVTVPLVEEPPRTPVGLTVSDNSVGATTGLTINTAFWVTPE